MAPERPNPELPEIEWPSEVTLDDLAQIRMLRSQGESLGASVARCIIAESESLVPTATPRLENLKLEEVPAMLMELNLIASYVAPALDLLVVEKSLKSQTVSMFELLPRKAKKILEVTNDLKIIVSPDKEKEQQETDSQMAVLQAEFQLTINPWEDILRQSGDPLQFIDLSAEGSSDELRQRGASELEIEAFNRGHQRFHDLYQAAQEAGLG